MAVVFKLPDLGENIESAQVVSIAVAVGDFVQADQTLIEVETDKAVTDVPAPIAGKLIEMAVSVGDKLSVGDMIATIEATASESPAPAVTAAAAAAPAVAAPPTAPPVATPPPAAEPESPPQVATSTSPEQIEVPVAENDRPVPASPSVRKFAREIGVDISQVSGSGPAGRISIDDIKAFNRRTPTGGPRGVARKALPDFRKWGEIDRQPMSNVRKKTALQMESGWQAPT